jgi:hypothetical protein
MIALAARYDRPAQFLGGALAVIAVSSFVTFYSKCSDIDIRMRTAIAGAVVVTYLIFFSLVVFSPPLQQASRGGYQDTQEQAAKTNVAAAKTKKPTTNETIPSDLFRMFSWVTAAVIGFYFGGRTVEKVADKLKA